MLTEFSIHLIFIFKTLNIDIFIHLQIKKLNTKSLCNILTYIHAYTHTHNPLNSRKKMGGRIDFLFENENQFFNQQNAHYLDSEF